MKLTAYTLHSFTSSNQGGNLAGIVLGADWLTPENMQKIASILGFSETAFVLKSTAATFKLKFFTPNNEVDLCGHATIGAWFTLALQGYLPPGKYSQETNAGILPIEITDNLTIMMDQPIPNFYDILDSQEIADSLQIPKQELAVDLPIQIVSTGLKDIIIPVKKLSVLQAMNPNLDKIKQVCQKHETVGYHVFTPESINNATAHCRNFAPLYDIPEESATGTSNGALGCYLFNYGKVSSKQAESMTFEQGYSMQNPSEILVALTTNNRTINKVKVGGKAANLTAIEIDF